MLMAGGADLLALGGVGLPHPDSKAQQPCRCKPVLSQQGHIAALFSP
jgi:hypothetical protein